MANRHFKYYPELPLSEQEKLLKQAQNEIKKLDSGDCFAAQDLFLGYVWGKLTPSDRKTFGRLFSFYVEKSGGKIIESIGRSGQRHIIYRKK